MGCVPNPDTACKSCPGALKTAIPASVLWNLGDIFPREGP